MANPHLSDRACLDLAVAIVRRHPERWQEFLGFVRERGWAEASMIASYDAQRHQPINPNPLAALAEAGPPPR